MRISASDVTSDNVLGR